MKYILWGIFGFVAFVIALLLIAPSFIDINNYKSQISEVAERYTGRKLTIKGDITLSLFPTVSLKIHDVSLANGSSFKEPTMVSISELQVQVATLPLVLRQEIHVDKFFLVKPEIALEVDSQGRKNWEFDTSTFKKDISSTKKAPTPTQENSGNRFPETLFFGNVGIEDGKVVYHDAQEKNDMTLKDVNATVTMASLNAPLTVAGKGTWNGKNTSIELKLENVNDALNAKETTFSTQISSDLVSIRYSGKVVLNKAIKAHGKLEAKSSDINQLANWLSGAQKDQAQKPQALTIDASVALSEKQVELANIELSYGDTAGIGEATVTFGQATPSVDADLVFSTLDFSPFMQDKSKAPSSTEEVPGQPAVTGWSEEPIDLKGLRAVNANIRLKADKIIAPPLAIGKSEVNLTLNQGKLNADIQEMAFYDGNIKGQMAVDASKGTTIIQKRIALSKVKVEPWLHDMAKFDKLSGTLDATIDVHTSGNSQKAWIESSSGNGSIFLSNGKLKGINLVKMIQNVAAAYTGNNTEESTDFSEASGTFTINQGIVSNQDLVIKAPLLQATGSGTADLPQKYLNYTFTPKVVGTLKGSQQTADLGGIAVPVKVEGPFSHLKYRPAAENVVKDILSDPTQAKDKLKDLERGVRSIRDSLKLELKGN